MVGAIVVAGVTYVVITPLWRKTGDTFTNLTEHLYRVVLARQIASGLVRH